MEANSRLKRPIYPMLDFVREAIEARPDYQRNDYLGWIIHARREDTKQKRLNQMLDEVEKGGVYMNMKWHPR